MDVAQADGLSRLMRWDVCIVGGGPAGASAALTLARYTSHRVCILEASNYEEPRIGESVSAALAPMLAYLGAGSILDGACAIPSFGNSAAWSGRDLIERDFIFTGHGGGLHLDRRRFDHALASSLEGLGGTLLLDARMKDLRRDGDEWRFGIDRAGESSDHVARILIDATGRRARVARWIGARLVPADRLIGLACVMELPHGPGPASTLVEAIEMGWWYVAPVPGGRAIAVLMTDADLLSARGKVGWDLFFDLLAQTDHVTKRLSGARPVGVPKVFPAQTQRLDTVCGEGWIAAGDAAAAFDPLAALGIGHALSGGIQAARIADEVLRGDDTLARAYPGDIERQRLAYGLNSRQLYDRQGRWPASAFWCRRRGARAETRAS